jgi:hypothetical protein
MRIRNTRFARLALLSLVIAAAGCEREDARLKKLTVGISKDSAVSAMGAKPDRTEPYLVHAQYIQTLFFARPGKTDSGSRALRKMAPVVTIGDKVVGWGWPYWDSVAGKNGIVIPDKK